MLLHIHVMYVCVSLSVLSVVCVCVNALYLYVFAHVSRRQRYIYRVSVVAISNNYCTFVFLPYGFCKSPVSLLQGVHIYYMTVATTGLLLNYQFMASLSVPKIMSDCKHCLH